MDLATNGFDSDLQMFVEQPREVDLTRLRFLRWLAERGRLEHGPFGVAVGEHAAEALADCLTS